jgi:hypothetical protein
MRLYVLLGLLCLVSIVFASGGYDIPPTATGDFKADGSVAMTGNLNIGTNDITEVVKIKSDNNSLDAIDVSGRRLHDTTGSLKLDWNLGYWFGDFNFTSNVVGGVADPVGDYDAVNKRTLASYVPTTRTVTVNGVEGVLSSNISFTVAGGSSGTNAVVGFIVNRSVAQTNALPDTFYQSLYNVEVYDSHNAFTNYQYTIPISGRWQIQASDRIAELDAGRYAAIQIQRITGSGTTTNAVLANLVYSPVASGQPSLCVGGMAVLAAGDIISINLFDNDATRNSFFQTSEFGRNQFSGFLVDTIYGE